MNETLEKLASVHLGNERSIWIREPATSAGGDSLTVFLDGEIYRDRIGAPAMLDELQSQGRIDDSWFVFVSYQSEEARWRECPCYPPFARFMADELLPWLGARRPALKSVRQKVLVGVSYTGLAAAFVAKEHPGVFQKIISQSGSFWWNDCWLVEQYKGLNQRLPTEFYLDVGSRETQEHVRHRHDVFQRVAQVDAVKRFRDVLLHQGHVVKYSEFDGAHDAADWRKSLPAALCWALPPGAGKRPA